MIAKIGELDDRAKNCASPTLTPLNQGPFDGPLDMLSWRGHGQGEERDESRARIQTRVPPSAPAHWMAPPWPATRRWAASNTSFVVTLCLQIGDITGDRHRPLKTARGNTISRRVPGAGGTGRDTTTAPPATPPQRELEVRYVRTGW